MKKTATTLNLILALFSIGISQNNCLDFDGVNDRVFIPSPVTGSDNFTIEFWLYAHHNNASNDLYITWGGSGTRFEIRTDQFGELSIYVYGPGVNNWYQSSVFINRDIWYHIAVTRNGNLTSLYIDGTFSLSFTKTYLLNTTIRLFFWNSDPSYHVTGQVDELRIWNVARTQTEIQNNMNSELIGNEPGLVTYYKFNQGVAGGNNSGVTTLIDETSNSNDGTLSNFLLNGNNSNWVGSGVSISINLPVELVGFHGKARKNQIDLTWSTASETNNAHFEIQKSKDGKDWQTLDFVKGQGTSVQVNEYQYQDVNPFPGINYYRLKQIDYDGSFEYSQVISVDFITAKKNIQVYPNPSDGLVNLNIENPLNQPIRVWVTDNLGREIWETGLIENEENLQRELVLEQDGIYLVAVQMGGEVFYERVVITGQ